MKRCFDHFYVFSICFFITFLWLPFGDFVQATPPGPTEEETESRQLIHAASQAVDEAWEEFHRAAIGGTLASPTIQTQIEGQLHEARGLLMEARQAERRGDHRSVKIITDQLFDLSHEIVLASREKKQ
jgi:hypothetical protein